MSCTQGEILKKGRCLSCNLELFNINSRGICIEKCGKGLRITNQIECDDGNMNNFDGCSSKCKKEKGFYCISEKNKADKCFKIDQNICRLDSYT